MIPETTVIRFITSSWGFCGLFDYRWNFDSGLIDFPGLCSGEAQPQRAPAEPVAAVPAPALWVIPLIP
jgi:hypothetical protein